MNNSETMATLGTQDTEGIHTKHHKVEIKKMSKRNPIKSGVNLDTPK
jgi:hypothetical protein